METAIRREPDLSESPLRMDALTASLAHELNQPLTSIISNSRAALRFIETGTLNLGELKEILEDISNEGKRAGEIIRSLRSMFNKEEREREAVAINLLLYEVAGFFKSEVVTRNVHLEFELTDLLPPVHINKLQIQQVVINLIMNALESIPDASRDRRITVRTSPTENGHVQVAICDTGSGVGEEDLARVFEPFFSRKPSGLGMGLSISRSIIQLHGGRIWAQRNPDKGSTFFFNLPGWGKAVIKGDDPKSEVNRLLPVIKQST